MMKHGFIRQLGLLAVLPASVLAITACDSGGDGGGGDGDTTPPSLGTCLKDMESGKGPKLYKEVGRFNTAADAANIDVSKVADVQEAYCSNLLSIQKIVLDLG